MTTRTEALTETAQALARATTALERMEAWLVAAIEVAEREKVDFADHREDYDDVVAEQRAYRAALAKLRELMQAEP